MHKNCKILIALIFLSAGFTSCKQQPHDKEKFTADNISSIYFEMMDLMIHDVTNPPLASRFFAYTTLAGYEVISQNEKGFKSMHRLLNQYPDLKTRYYTGLCLPAKRPTCHAGNS